MEFLRLRQYLSNQGLLLYWLWFFIQKGCILVSSQAHSTQRNLTYERPIPCVFLKFHTISSIQTTMNIAIYWKILKRIIEMLYQLYPQKVDFSLHHYHHHAIFKKRYSVFYLQYQKIDASFSRYHQHRVFLQLRKIFHGVSTVTFSKTTFSLYSAWTHTIHHRWCKISVLKSNTNMWWRMELSCLPCTSQLLLNWEAK